MNHKKVIKECLKFLELESWEQNPELVIEELSILVCSERENIAILQDLNSLHRSQILDLNNGR